MFEGTGLFVSIHREKDGAPWLVQCISEQEIPESVLTPIHHGPWEFETIPDDTDWLAKSYQQFPAFVVGPFFIYGSHHEGGAPDEKIGLQIDAATAFGSGEHGTTKGCLLAMVDLKDAGVCPWNVLDMGTGSGILGLAAWKLWKTPVLAVDNDPESVRVTARHRDMNHVPGDSTGLVCEAGDGFAAPLVQQKKPFDLVIANILAVTLREMVNDLQAVCDKNGFIILSGILNKQAAEVLATYEPLGFVLKNRYDIAEWSTLTLQHTA
ncbi:MAG: 50S ribosomal protein L11 methyltransferase [Alphaproteobacteria bacterium]